MPPKPFRFGVVAAGAASGAAWSALARRVEALGYATLVVPDNVEHLPAPVPALAAAAAATTTLRVGTYVLANDFRHPVLVAKDAATLDFLSGGRFELGLGAGRPAAAADHRMLGLPFNRGGVRVDRLAEALGIVKALLAGERVSSPGPHFAVEGAHLTIRPVQRPRPPILVAGSGPRLLALAAREADTVALGIRHDEGEASVAEKVGRLREAAGGRFDDLELNLNLMAVGARVPRYLSTNLGLTADALAAAGAVAALTGTPDRMADRLHQLRDRLGLSYFLVADELMDDLAPVVQRLAGR